MNYNREELMERLRTKESVVTFTKLNGEQRIMTCTLDPSLIPEEHMPKSDKPKKEPSAKQLENIGVYDLNAKGWRSFKVSNVTDVQTTEEAHEELIDVIKRPVRHYRIRLWGYGGESVYGRISKEAYKFWNDVKEGKTELDHPEYDNLESYMANPEEFRKHVDIPQEADFLFDMKNEFHQQWYEKDDIEHMNGVTLDSARIEVDEVSDESYGSKWLETVCEDMMLDKLLEMKNKEVDQDYFDLDAHGDEDGHNYVFYGMSIEKGTFNDVYLRTEGKKFDVSKLDVKAMEMPNGDNIITEILYNGVPLDGDFGDTNGKGYVCDVWDY